MTVSGKILYTAVDNLLLDPLNPRLGRGNTGLKVTQSAILSQMRGNKSGHGKSPAMVDGSP